VASCPVRALPSASFGVGRRRSPIGSCAKAPQSGLVQNQGTFSGMDR
jgi:hypothetical protein